MTPEQADEIQLMWESLKYPKPCEHADLEHLTHDKCETGKFVCLTCGQIIHPS